MNKQERRINNLLTLLQESPNLSVKNLAGTLNVSEMTIRRDLKYLKENHLFVRAHGIPILSNVNNLKFTNIENEYTLSSEQAKYIEQKQAIGRFAATLIAPNDTIILDNGTTIAEMSKYIPDHNNLDITCYNFFTLSQLFLMEDVRITLAGGLLHKADQMFESSYAVELIKNQRANKFFLAASGIHEALGLTCAHNYEVLIKRAAMGSSLSTILLADSSKFGLIRTAYVSQISEIDVIVTDSGISDEWKQLIESQNIKLYVV